MAPAARRALRPRRARCPWKRRKPRWSGALRSRARQDSNLRPLAPEASALSTELRAPARAAYRLRPFGPDGPLALLRRHGGLRADRAARPAGASGAARRAQAALRLRRGHAAPAPALRRAARGLRDLPHALPPRPLA